MFLPMLFPHDPVVQLVDRAGPSAIGSASRKISGGQIVNSGSAEIDLDHLVDQICKLPLLNPFEHLSEQLSLHLRGDVRNDDHQARMKFGGSHQASEIAGVVSDNNQILRNREATQLLIACARLSSMTNVMRLVPRVVKRLEEARCGGIRRSGTSSPARPRWRATDDAEDGRGADTPPRKSSQARVVPV